MPTYEDAAGLIESYAASGVTVPYGTYLLQRTVVLPEGSRLSMASQCELRIAHTGTGVSIDASDVQVTGGTISGGLVLSDWVDDGDGTWSHDVSDSYKIRQMHVNGARRYPARYPETGYLTYVSSSDPSFTFTDPVGDLVADLPSVASDVELYEWWDYESRGRTLVSLSLAGGLNFTAVTNGTLLQYTSAPNGHYWLSNVPLLTAGTFWHDRTNGKIHYMPVEGEYAGSFSAVVPYCQALVRVNATNPGTPTTGVSFTGVAFLYGRQPFADSSVVMYSNTTRQAAAVTSTWRNDGLEFTECLFAHMEGSALHTGVYFTSGVVVSRCHFADLGSSGFSAGEASRAYINADYNDSSVSSCVFEGVGLLMFTSPAIALPAPSGAVVKGCKIRDCPYIGLLFGPGIDKDAGGYNEISGCEFSNCMYLLNDGGMLYFVGRNPQTEITDCAFHTLDASDDPSVGLYYEAAAEGASASGCLFSGFTSFYGHGPWSFGNLFVGNTLATLNGGVTIFSPENRNFAPGEVLSWHDTNIRSELRGSLTLDITDNGDGTSTLTTTSRSWNAGSATVYLSDMPVSMWVLFTSGTEAGNWYQVVDQTSTTLDLDGVPAAVATDKFVVIATRADGNSIVSDEAATVLLAAWQGTHPEPPSLKTEYDGPECWFDFPENSPMIPAIL
jgi:hypothetical protein